MRFNMIRSSDNLRTIDKKCPNNFSMSDESIFVCNASKEQEGIIRSLCPQCMLSTNTGHTDKNILDKSSAMILFYRDGISYDNARGNGVRHTMLIVLYLRY